MDRRDAESVDQAHRVAGESVHVIAVPSRGALALTAPIDCHTTVFVSKRSNLWIKHPPTEEQSVTEEHRRRVGPTGRWLAVRVVDRCAVTGQGRHRCPVDMVR